MHIIENIAKQSKLPGPYHSENDNQKLLQHDSDIKSTPITQKERLFNGLHNNLLK
jgi:hypothetical protein